ncbi:MAG: DUF1614 domain-containing protein [Acidiferrobacterales bacterium]
MKLPIAPVRFGLFLAVIAFLFAIVQLGVISIAFDKLGLSPHQAMILFLLSLAGSVINLPIVQVENTAVPGTQVPPAPYGLLRPQARPFEGRTIIAVNIGGCVIPVLFSIHLIYSYQLALVPLLGAILFVTLVSRFVSTPIPGIGIGMPVLVAPFAAALVGILLGGNDSAPMAYIAGTLGVLIGADLLRMKDILGLAVPVASIGGAGTFDGIYFTGIVAVLLA